MIHLLKSDRSPEAFYKDVVINATPANYADSDILLLQPLDEIATGKEKTT
jgi:hypothetical protein